MGEGPHETAVGVMLLFSDRLLMTGLEYPDCAGAGEYELEEAEEEEEEDEEAEEEEVGRMGLMWPSRSRRARRSFPTTAVC